MSHLIIFGLIVVVLWLARRHWLLQNGVDRLAAAMHQQRPFLGDDPALSRPNSPWRKLAAEANRLIRTINHLSQQRADQLSQLETALRNLQEAVVIVDSNNYIILANSALNAMFPAVQGSVSKRVETVLRSADFLSYLGDVRNGGASPRREVLFNEATGAVWVEATGVTVAPALEQTEPWTLFVLHDITRERKLEAIRKEFIANVSHELKTPLSVIKGYAETLADDHMSMEVPQREQFIRAIYRHSERLASIIEDLLTLSRLESPNPGMHAVMQPVAPLITAVAQDFAQPVQQSGHQLIVAVDEPDRISACIDGLRLTQVLANLIDNARKYTPRGSIIEIGARAVPADREVEIWVRDTGPGIPPADLPRIFERFYRVEKGRSRGQGGTGLGLSIVKHIVHLHGGRVWAESALGHGTRVALRLPQQGGGASVDATRSGVHLQPAPVSV